MNDHQNNMELARQDTFDWLFKKPQFWQWQDEIDFPSYYGVLWMKSNSWLGGRH